MTYHWVERGDEFHFRVITLVCSDIGKCGWVSQEPGASAEGGWYWCSFIDTGKNAGSFENHTRVQDGYSNTLKEAQENVLRTHNLIGKN